MAVEIKGEVIDKNNETVGDKQESIVDHYEIDLVGFMEETKPSRKVYVKLGPDDGDNL